MSKSLGLSLIIFSLIWIIYLLGCVRRGRLSIKYSLPWLFASLLILIVTLFKDFLNYFANMFGFLPSDFIVGIILTLLLLITLLLTMIVTNLKTQIKDLIQEISILKEKDKK